MCLANWLEVFVPSLPSSFSEQRHRTTLMVLAFNLWEFVIGCSRCTRTYPLIIFLVQVSTAFNWNISSSKNSYKYGAKYICLDIQSLRSAFMEQKMAQILKIIY